MGGGSWVGGVGSIVAGVFAAAFGQLPLAIMLIGTGIVSLGVAAFSGGSGGPAEVEPPNFGNISGSVRYGFGELRNTTSSEVPVAIIYGEIKVAGNNLYQSGAGETVTRAVSLCEGEIDSVSDIRLNDVPIAECTGCSQTTYTGTSTQTMDSRFTGLVFGLRYTAYLAFTLAASEKVKGAVNITCIVKGTKVRTWNGSVWSTDLTWSNNPAACVLDFLTNTRYGCGIADDQLDLDSFGEVYDHCKEQVDDGTGTSTNENRYNLDYVIDTKRPQLDLLNEMTSSFGGFLVNSQGRLKLQVEKTETVTQCFTMDSIVADSFSYALSGKDDIYNRVKVLYIDPDQNYTKVFAIAEDYNNQEIRKEMEGSDGLCEKEVQLFPIIRFSQASRLASLYLRLSQLCGIVCTFKASINAVRCEPGDVVAISHDVPQWINKTFRILSIKESANDEREIICREYVSEIHDDGYGTGSIAFISQPVDPPSDYENAPLPSPTSIVAAEENWINKDGTYISDIRVTWAGITKGLEYFVSYIVELKKGDEEYVQVGATTKNTIVIPDVDNPNSYTIRVKTSSSSGYISSGATSNTLSVVGKIGYPGNVSGLTATFTDEIKFNWSRNTDLDLWGYELRTSDVNWASGDTGGFIWRGTGLNYILQRPPSRAPGTYYLRSIDTSGNYAATSATVTPTNAAPIAPTLKTTNWFGYGEIEWTDTNDSDLLYYEVHKADNTSGDYILHARVSGTRCVVNCDTPMTGSGDTFGNDGSVAYLEDSILASSGDSRFIGNMLTIMRGAGIGQSKTIIGYVAASGRVSGDSAWSPVPDVTSEWVITDKRYYKVLGVDTFGSGDFSSPSTISFDTLSESMIGDQVITARKIFSGEVITLSAQIKDAIITSAKINSLEANKITTGTLGASESISIGGNTIIDGDGTIKVFSDEMTIADGVNSVLDWVEDAATIKADLNSDDFTPTEFAAHMQAQMRASGDDNTTVTYDSDTRLITIANSTLSTFSLLFATGANNSESCAQVVGFSPLLDYTGALSYTAPYQFGLRVLIGKIQ